MEEHGFWTNPQIARLTDISNNEARLLAIVDCMSRKEGFCWCSNRTLRDLTHISQRTLQSSLAQLETKGYLIRSSGTKDETIPRRLQVTSNLRTVQGGADFARGDADFARGGDANFAVPPTQDLHPDKIRDTTRGERPARPTLEEVRDYFNANNMSSNPEQFFDYYTANGWVQGKGKPIHDWQATARNWERREEKYRPAQVAQEPPPSIPEGFRLHIDADGKKHIIREGTV